MERKIVELFLEGKSMREIMRALKCGDRRVRKIKTLAEEYGYLGKTPCVPLPPYPEGLFPDGPDGRESKGSEANTLILTRKPWITERLGIAVSRSSFYRFLHRHGLYELADSRCRRVIPEIRHSPGEALILDWGKLRDVLDPLTGKKRTLWAFVGVLGYSRYMMVRLVWSNETKLTLTTIESMLKEIGGVPGRVTSDNPKCFALEASLYEPILNPAFERMAGHYGTSKPASATPWACRFRICLPEGAQREGFQAPMSGVTCPETACCPQSAWAGSLSYWSTRPMPEKKRGLKTRLKNARFPEITTLESFDFSFNPDIDEEKIRDLATLRRVNVRHSEWPMPTLPWLSQNFRK